MKIGILAYHSACNFGASLQLLSTFCYLKNNGHDPIIINWVPEDLEEFYKKPTPKVQYEMQQNFRRTVWTETALCRTSQDVAKEIENNGIEAVIVGSDAVAQHHTKRERIVFPTRRIVSISKATSDRIYPNPFWGEFNKYLKAPIPVAYLSASSQDSVFSYYPKELKSQMGDSLMKYSHLSVRDTWTRDMFSYLTDGRRVPEVTPDPVFAFNYNCADIIPSKQVIQDKFNLPTKYILMSFEPKRGVTQHWIDKFVTEAQKRGISIVGMPFSMMPSIGNYPTSIEYPLTPLEWYALIKYSCGYVGNNMHPIVVSLHNANPFFSFDNYGKISLKGLIASDKSSKIKHILGVAGFDSYRVFCRKRNYILPEQNRILDMLETFDKKKAELFASKYYESYLNNMNRIIESFNNGTNQ